MDQDDTEPTWPPEPETRIDRRIVGAVHGAEHALRRRLAISASDFGLDPTETLILATLQVEPGCAPQQIRRRIGLQSTTLASALGRLERGNQVERHRLPGDGRTFSIRLTRAGGLSAEFAYDIISGIEAELAGYTSPAERRGAAAVYEACIAIGQRERRDRW